MREDLFQKLLSSVKEMVAIENGELEPKPEHVHRHVVSDSDFKFTENCFNVEKKLQKK
ncbi:hypothetical protein [Xenorhabdus hominickii]|uniref:Transcriptional regulator n=1 Tax=Xenorhabdus hominickii TaxID=351679 RepID=A0A1V0M4U0_XENHO|nr:hypothetical protein [Xenorhabdus hominickii]ARD69895.1 hypothetical protein [Xenorhabdus hominickii]PHM51439.1 transcriptional regulator [Xenorhabdus hominickii]